MSAYTDGNRFLADVGVTGAMDQASLMRFRELLLGAANEKHAAVQAQQAFLVDRNGGHEILGSRDSIW